MRGKVAGVNRVSRLARRVRDGLLLPIHLASSLTRTGWFLLLLILIVMVVALRGAQNVAFLIAMVMVAVLATSAYVSRRALRHLVLRRAAPRRVEAGSSFHVFLSLSNAKRLLPAFAVYAIDRLPGAPWLRPAFAYAEAVPASGTERACYSMNLRRRGVYQFAPTRLESAFPFGIFRAAAYAGVPAQLVVYPKMMQVSSAFFEETERRLDEIRVWRRTPYEEDFRGLREYHHGDNPKWIHWRTSARMRKKLVREFEKPESKRITMLLETLINPRAMNNRRRAHLEMGVRFAASLGLECVRRGYEFSFLAYTPERTVVTIGGDSPNIETLLDVLAALAPTRSGSVGDLLAHMNPVLLRDAVVLAVRLGFAGVGEGGAGPLEPPAGVPEDLFWEVTVGTGQFRRLFGRGVTR